MTQRCQSWLNSLFLLSQQNPPKFVEILMIALALIMFSIWTLQLNQLPYVILGLAFVISASTSLLVRQTTTPITPTYRPSRLGYFLAIASLTTSIYTLIHILLPYL
ncbi:MAG: hypothetical protein AAF378_05225 [Cyanobacteria bacterium P01_A01_bin.84]